MAPLLKVSKIRNLNVQEFFTPRKVKNLGAAFLFSQREWVQKVELTIDLCLLRLTNIQFIIQIMIHALISFDLQ